jgi:type I restriction enzyme R subunit
MIGRGTRLRPDLFGPGENKKHFLIFDYCGNFEFFDENPDGYEATTGPSLSAKIFEKKLLLTAKLKNEPFKQDEDLQQYRSRLLDQLHQNVSNLERQSIQVRPHLKLVHKLEDRSVWEHLESHERKEIVRDLAEIIPVDSNENELRRRFDYLMLVLQHQLLDGVLQEKSTFNNVVEMAERLYTKKHIPAIKNVLPAIERVMTEEFWKEASVIDLDQINQDLRELVELIDRESLTPVYSDFEDTFSTPREREMEISVTDSSVDPERYKRKIRKFIEEHKNHLVIEKIRQAKALTDKDIETLESFLISADPSINPDDFHEILGDGMELITFIRSATGLERETVIKEFEEFLRDRRLSSNQIEFIKQMIEFYTQKGHLDIANLYEPPFDFIDQDGIDGVFRDRINVVDVLITKVKKLNEVKVG